MRVGVLGGGLQGCCIALLLAERGVKVTLFERHNALLRGAASNNEGKVHLGYVYAGDQTLATARLMIRGALAFAPIIERFLERRTACQLSSPFYYAIHRDSQKTPDEYARYLDAVQHEIEQASGGRQCDYFGIELSRPERLSASELDGLFDVTTVSAAFRTAEIAVDIVPLCDALAARIAAEPNISLRLAHTVIEVADHDKGYAVKTKSGDTETFDHVVNALWDGRFAVDAQRGIHPPRAWLHRLKYGLRFHAPEMTVSSTIVLGPFGDTVAYEDGTCYASWYPVCMRASSSRIAPPPVTPLTRAERDALCNESIRALRAIVPAMGRIQDDEIARVDVRRGIITALARTDIDDPCSELHARYDIGVFSSGGYHSVDPGKFTLAPYFATVCADRILSAGTGR